MAKGGYCTHCQYDLRGTIQAGRTVCPECGQLIERSQLSGAESKNDP